MDRGRGRGCLYVCVPQISSPEIDSEESSHPFLIVHFALEPKTRPLDVFMDVAYLARLRSGSVSSLQLISNPPLAQSNNESRIK